MSTFKEMIQEDTKNIFLDFNMFGEMHTINEQEVCIIIDDMELTNREKKMQGKEGDLHSRQLLFYVDARDFGALPDPGKYLFLDGNRYLITDVADESGIYSISLEAMKS